MRVLLVEDHLGFIRTVQPKLERIAGEDGLEIAKSRDSALERLKGREFDVVLLDQKIPTRDDQLDEDESHGRAVFSEIRSLYPGTSIWFLTAFGMDDFIDEMLKDNVQEDIFGTKNRVSLLRKFNKKDADKCFEQLGDFRREIDNLNNIEVVPEPDLELGVTEKRMIRVSARRYGGALAEVKALTGGLSGSPIYQVHVKGPRGGSKIIGAAKIIELSDIDDEVARYDDVKRLRGRHYAPLISDVRAGAGKYGCVFYKLAEEYRRNMFDVQNTNLAETPGVLSKIVELEKPWTSDFEEEEHSVREILKISCGDIEVADLIQSDSVWKRCLDSAGAEERLKEVQNMLDGDLLGRPVHARVSCQHGDLHGANVLLDEKLDPIVIDFGEVRRAPACFDAITLELSTLFHPDRPKYAEEVSVDKLEQWSDLDKYSKGHPAEEFVKACREWARAVGGGQRSIYTSACGYAARQLNYEDTDKLKALAIMRCCISSLADSYK